MGAEKLRIAPGARCIVTVGGVRYAAEVVASGHDTAGVICRESEFLADAGDDADLEFLDVQCRVVYHMQVVVAPSKPGDGMILQRAASAAYARRRRTWRVSLEAPVTISREGAGQSLECRVINLSTEGALLAAKAPIAIGEMITLYLALPGEAEHAIATRVLRREEGEPPCYGVRFAAVSPEARHALTRFMWARLRALYPGDIAAMWPGNKKRRVSKEVWNELMRQSGLNREESQ